MSPSLLAAASSSASSSACSSASASASVETGSLSIKTTPINPRPRGHPHLADLDLKTDKAEFIFIWEGRELIVKQKRDCEVALNDCLTGNELFEGMQNGCIDNRFSICPQISNATIITTLSSNGCDKIQVSASKELSEDEFMSSSVVDEADESVSTRYEIVG